MFVNVITKITAGVVAITGLAEAVKKLWGVVGEGVKKCFNNIKSRFASRRSRRTAVAC